MLIENLSIKGSSPFNEDAQVADFQRNVFAVIDGATSLTPYMSAEGFTGGYLASRLVASTIERLLDGGDIMPLPDMLLEANRVLRSEMQKAGIDADQKEQLWSAGAVVIRISPDGIEYAQSGDCMLVAVYQDGTIRVVTRDQLAHVDRETYRLWAEGAAKGLTTRDQLWDCVKPQIVDGRQSANTPAGYGVLNGDPEAARYLEFGRINRINLKSLLLMSDGIYVPKRAGETPFDAVEAARRIQQSNLHDYMKDIIGIEESDPDCLVFPRVKKSDDKTAVWIEF
jgi:serine/threonine protein phosphatase PrpC